MRFSHDVGGKVIWKAIYDSIVIKFTDVFFNKKSDTIYF